MPFSCFLYPAVGSSYTQLLGSIIPSGWVDSYPAAGYERTYSLGTINIATIIRRTSPKALNRECSLHSLPFTSLRSVTVGSGRFGVGLLGLLEPADPEPVLAGVVAHADAATVEAQVVRADVVLWVSTRRPIVAVVANVG